MATARASADSQAPSRRYHHGNLREALVEVGVELAREGGLDAIVMREATRRVGVTPRAAYRHVSDRDALVGEVARVALTQMATGIRERISRIRPQSPLDGARQALHAVGTGYIDYALAEPGLFEVAMYGLDDMALARPTATGDAHASPYEALEGVLGGLVEAGVLEAGALPAAATMCWSSVHGFATLATRGPLRELPRVRAAALGVEVVDLVVAGLSGRAAV